MNLLNPFKKNQPNIGKPFALPAIQGFLVHYEMLGCETVELIESPDTVKLFALVAELFSDGITDIYIERVTFKRELVQ
jgi:hypothetical protein